MTSNLHAAYAAARQAEIAHAAMHAPHEPRLPRRHLRLSEALADLLEWRPRRRERPVTLTPSPRGA